MEIWADIKGYEGWYQVSTWGRVRSVDRQIDDVSNRKRIAKGQILAQEENPKGYLRVHLSKTNCKLKHFRVHRIVAETFIDNPYNLPEVNHIDGNKQNNSVSNLEWCTGKENRNHYKCLREGSYVWKRNI